jgi:hypothetical protein
MARAPGNDPEDAKRRAAAASSALAEEPGFNDDLAPAEDADENAGFFFPRWLRATAKAVGFLLLAAPAIVIVAALIVLPEYAAWQNDVYQRDLAAAQTADLESLKDAQERMVRAAYDDQAFIKRLAMWNLNVLPAGEQILESALPPAPPPGQVTIPPHPRPAPPDDQFLRAAAKVSLPSDPASPEYKERAATRRGLFAVAVGLLLFAILLFGPGAKRGLRGRSVRPT